MKLLHQCCILATLSALAIMVEAGVPKRSSSMPYLRQADLSKYLSQSSPSSSSSSSSSEYTVNDSQWLSISEGVEFMPNTNLPPLPKSSRGRKLEMEDGEESTTGAWEEYDPYSVQPFVEGMSEYDEYQQAWRLLGFMIDCNSVDDDDGSGSGSQDVTEDGCARYVLWAAVSKIQVYGMAVLYSIESMDFFNGIPLLKINCTSSRVVVRRLGLRRRWYRGIPILGPSYTILE